AFSDAKISTAGASRITSIPSNAIVLQAVTVLVPSPFRITTVQLRQSPFQQRSADEIPSIFKN
ncbi:hypothetical protein OFO99_40490, partial [Escherichia coli]|nr:hypothetical protein [Escherichia coli]